MPGSGTRTTRSPRIRCGKLIDRHLCWLFLLAMQEQHAFWVLGATACLFAFLRKTCLGAIYAFVVPGRSRNYDHLFAIRRSRCRWLRPIVSTSRGFTMVVVVVLVLMLGAAYVKMV